MRRAALAALALVLVAAPLAHDRVTTRVTWTRDIAPIVAARCAGCHQPAGPAPMSLATYETARPWAKAMRLETATGRMPMWAAARGIGRFSNDRSLQPFEAALIAAWADGGAPRGDDARVAASHADITMPDLTLRLPRRVSEPAGQTVSVELALPGRRDEWATAWWFHPNDPAIVAAEFFLDGRIPLAAWTAPDVWVRLPEGAGLRLPAGGIVTANIYFRINKLQLDFPVGLPSLPPVLAFVTTRGQRPSAELRSVDVPCGVSAAPAGRIVSVRPLVVSPGEPIGAARVYDDAPPVPLVRVRDVDDATTYRLVDPVEIRSGARLLVESRTPDCAVRLEVAR